MQLDRHISENFIRYALHIGAVDGSRTWRTKSGRLSPYFFNAGAFLTGESLDKLMLAYAEALYPHLYTRDLPVMFGPAYKGTLLVPALVLMLWKEYDMRVSFASNRKEAKDHGEGGMLIGAPLQGRRVLIVDDVISDGASKREAVEFIRREGGILVGCVIAFDRKEKGEETNLSAAEQFEQEYEVPLIAAATANDLISVLREDGHSPDMLAALVAYQERYGVS
jgi:orotate phosphoribosyltransferase